MKANVELTLDQLDTKERIESRSQPLATAKDFLKVGSARHKGKN